MIQASQMEATFKTAEGIDQVIDFIKAWDYGNEPLKVKVYGAGTTEPYRSVFWIWMRSFSKQLMERGSRTKLDKEGKKLHNIVCNALLGTVPAEMNPKTGEVLTPETLITLTNPQDLDRGQWYDLMRRLEEMAIGWGCTIPVYENSEYEQDKRKQNQ